MTINTEGQIKVDLKKKLNTQINKRANQNTDKAINKGLDEIEGAIKEDMKKKNGAEQAGEIPTNQGEKSPTKSDSDSGIQSAGQQQTSLQSYSKYDFIPGEKVIFYEDFRQDAVGDFPALWNTNGTAEVVTTNLYPGNWMKFVMREGLRTDSKDVF